MFGFVKIIAFNIFGFLNSTQKDSIFLFPAVFTLEDTKIHVCTFNSDNVAFYIKVPIDQFFHLTITLDIPDIHPNNSHVQLREDFNNT